MGLFLLYLLKTSVCLVVFYLFFKAFLSDETFFRFNRRILIYGTVVCFILPLIQLPAKEPSVIQTPFLVIEETLTGFDTGQVSELPEMVMPEKHEAKSMFFISLTDILLILYFLGLAVNLVILSKSFFAMTGIIRNSKMIIYKGYKIVLVEDNIPAFSWRKYIVISKEDYQSHPDEIITHEIAHIKQNHSLDLILFELFVVLQWFNPVVWLLKKELKDIHEYQADVYVIQTGIDATRYQLLLVKKAVGSSSYTLANSFNHSKLKKRITMMLKEKSNKWTRLKLLFLVPLSVVALQAFSHVPLMEKEISNFPVMTLSDQDKNTTIIPPDQKEKVEFYHVFIYSDANNPEKRALLKSVRLTPIEYEQFLNQTTGNFTEEKDLVHPESGYATSRGYWLDKDGRRQQTITAYHELSGDQEKDLLKREQVIPPPPPFFSSQVAGYPKGTDNYYLLVNRLGAMLFQDDFINLNNLEEKLSADLFKNRGHKTKPVVLTIIHDKATNVADLEKIYAAIQRTFAINEQSADFDNVFARIGDIKEFDYRNKANK